LVQYANFDWVKLLPKSIVVGIANVDRRRDFTYPTTIQKDKQDFPTTGGSEKFIRFIENELQPFIEKKYNTNGKNMLIGQSLGGLLAAEILVKKPTLFSSYVIISPSFWWDNESLLKAAKTQIALPANTSVYVGVGNEGKTMVNDAKQLVKILKGANANTAFHYFKKENHATIFHLAVYDAFVNFDTMAKAAVKN
ncbi:MAG: alpha/beta hydrolase, partial [Flavobacterium sp.]